MQFLKFFQKRDAFFWVSILTSLMIIVVCFESAPLHHTASNKLVLFLNSFFGYKFFHKSASFYLSDFFILIIFTICIFKIKNKTIFFEKSSLYLLVFVFLLLLSAYLSFWPRASQFFLVFNFFTIYLFVISLSSILNENNILKFLNVVFFALIIASFFECFLAFYQYFMQKSLGLKGLHEPIFSEKNLSLASFLSSNGSRWIFDDLFHVERKVNLILRATGSFGHANNFGGFMFFSTIASTYFFLISKKNWQKILLSLLLFLQIFAIYLSYSRSALFGFIIAFSCFFIFVYLKKEHFILSEYKKLFLVIFGSLVLSFSLLYPQLLDRGGVVKYNELAEASDRGRLNYQIVAAEMIKKHPIMGVGLSRFYQRCNEFIPEEKRGNMKTGIVHNIYLLIASENGLFALLFLLIFIFSIFKAAFFQKPSITLYLLSSFFIGFLFIGLCDYYLIDKTVGRFIFFFLSALIMALGAYEKKPLLKFLNWKKSLD